MLIAGVVIAVILLRGRGEERPPVLSDAPGVTAFDATSPDATASADVETQSPAGDLGPAAPTGDKYVPGAYVISATKNVYLRADHNKSASPLTKLAPGTQFTVTSVYEDPAPADASVHWWGYVNYGGVVGWIALYYATEAAPEQLTSSVSEVWQLLNGYWNTDDGKMFISFTVENGRRTMLSGVWYSEGDQPGYAEESDCKGSLRRTVSIPLHYEAVYNEMNQWPESYEDLLVDLSEVENGRIAVKFPNGNWVPVQYAGATMDAARPPLT